jgi:hypothetical protein
LGWLIQIVGSLGWVNVGCVAMEEFLMVHLIRDIRTCVVPVVSGWLGGKSASESISRRQITWKFEEDYTLVYTEEEDVVVMDTVVLLFGSFCKRVIAACKTYKHLSLRPGSLDDARAYYHMDLDEPRDQLCLLSCREPVCILLKLSPGDIIKLKTDIDVQEFWYII